MRTVYNTSFIRIDIDTRQRALVLHWKAVNLSPQAYRAALLEGLKFAHQYELTHWISNQKDMKLLSLRAEAWVLDTFFPRLIDSPIEEIILIQSDDEFNREVTRYLYSQPIARKVPLRLEDTVYEAFTWVGRHEPLLATAI